MTAGSIFIKISIYNIKSILKPDLYNNVILSLSEEIFNE